jgi:membrane protein involved in colicin uptake
MTYQIGIYDHETGEAIVRDMTAQEAAERDAEIAERKALDDAQNKAEKDAEQKKLVALAKLEALGINVDDLKVLGLG